MASTRWLPFAVALVLATLVPSTRGQPPKPEAEKPVPGAVETRLADGAKTKVTLVGPTVDIVTPYGKLSVPVAEIITLDLMTRVPEADRAAGQKAVADLGNADPKTRSDAEARLLQLGVKAQPALAAALKGTEAEVKRRAEEVLQKIKKKFPDGLKVRKDDVLTTEDAKFVGRLEGDSLKVRTATGEEKSVALADLRGLRSLTLKPEVASAANVQPDPGSPDGLANQIGKSFYFKVTGAAQGSLWGTDTYTSDSSIRVAAVHAGILKVGETGIVKLTIVAPLQAYEGTVRNDISSRPYGPYSGAYRLEKAEEDE